MKIAAKPDTKSGYISKPDPYCVFTPVNRNEIMNTYHANIATTAAIPARSGIVLRHHSRRGQERSVERFSGIRSSGQYCCPEELTRTYTQMTEHRGVRRQSAVDGMCS